MLNKIIIITPAIPRKELHKKSFASLYDSLNGYQDENIKLYHIINIDCPEKILSYGYTLEETIDNFNQIIPNDVEKIYLHGYEPNFTTSYTRLWQIANNYIDDNGVILFFEDDWEINSQINYINILSVIHQNYKNYIFTSYHNIDNQPHIVSNGYYQYFNEYLNTKSYSDTTDPDYIRGFFIKYYLKKFKNRLLFNYNRIIFEKGNKNKIDRFYGKFFKRKNIKSIKDYKIYNYKVNTYDILIENKKLIYIGDKQKEDTEEIVLNILSPAIIKFSYDIGREWRDNLKIKKWDKNDKNLKTY